MPKLFTSVAAAALALGASAAPAADRPESPIFNSEIEFLKIDHDITVRRMVVRNQAAKGVVLFLHGFPETLFAWQDVSASLAKDYEIHAFDWPGFGLSTRPMPDKFGYAPKDFAHVLKAYIDKAGIDRSRLVIYATDIGALPALLAALDDPDIARTIIVGDFAPFDRPHLMQERLQALKSASTGGEVRAQFNAARDEILENAMRRGLKPEEQFEISSAFKADMAQGWNHGSITTADAFANYYAQFTRDQDYLEANIGRLKTPVKVVWGERDIYIDKEMGVEFAARVNARLSLLPGIGHYPHLQQPNRAAAEVRASFAGHR